MQKRHVLGLLVLAELFGAACSRCASDKQKSQQDNLNQIVSHFFVEPQQEEQPDMYTVKAQMEQKWGYDLPPEMMQNGNRVLLHEPMETINVDLGFSSARVVSFDR